MGMALTPCIVPAAGKPSFELGDDEMEIGMGIHGEPGTHRDKLRPADDVAEHLTEQGAGRLPFQSGDEVAVMINGLGATPLMELYIINRKVAAMLEDTEHQGVPHVRGRVHDVAGDGGGVGDAA